MKNTHWIPLHMFNPLNREEEKRKFLFDALYNPQFTYEKGIKQEDRERYGKISDKYLPQAKWILDTVMKTWGSEEVFLEATEGPLLSRDQTTEIARKYLEQNHIERDVQIRFSSRSASPANMMDNVLTFRLPMSQRTHKLLGVLHHEVGTHYFRGLNEQHQLWYKNREAYELLPHYDTEEGLAVLHSHVTVEHPMLWFAALYYYLVYIGETHTFVELNKEVKKYILDQDRRWNICVRVKRGITDTSVPGAFGKDQVYLRGVIRVLDWLMHHHYDPRPLYLGKIAIQDLPKARAIAIKAWKPQLPIFLQAFGEEYIAAIQRIQKENHL